MSEVKDFLKKLSQNPEAKKLMKEAGEPAGMEEAAALYAGIAEKAGISVTKETIQKLLEGKEKAQREMTAKAEGAVKTALNEDGLESVAGGVQVENCESTADTGEWCWFSDSCSVVINYYDDSSTKKKYYTWDESFEDIDGDDPKYWDECVLGPKF